jgi:hypothetical protein
LAVYKRIKNPLAKSLRILIEKVVILYVTLGTRSPKEEKVPNFQSLPLLWITWGKKA